MDKVAMIIGAGFSKNAGLPITKEVTKLFLDRTIGPEAGSNIRLAIIDALEAFWKDVFAYDGETAPSFEDHFTLLDLAANAGHNLGKSYSPAQLRAIRRLSLHRVFDVLDSRYAHNADMEALLAKLASSDGSSVISTNWDIVVEKHLKSEYSYKLDMGQIPYNRKKAPMKGLPLLKLHGSANWAYCDSCQRLFAFQLDQGKGILHSNIFLEYRDFETLDRLKDLDSFTQNELRNSKGVLCRSCHTRLSARVATFSYSKSLQYFQFQAVWRRALTALRLAKTWIFFGYGLPEADFQIRHLLKTAQMGRKNPLKIFVALRRRDDSSAPNETKESYKRFFGTQIANFIEEEEDVLLRKVTATLG